MPHVSWQHGFMIRRRVALVLTACAAAVGCSGSRTPAPSSATVVTVPDASNKPKATKASGDDVPAPSSNSGAWVAGDEDVAEAVPEEDEYDGPIPTPWGSSASGPTGGPECDRAADCCLKILSVSSVGTAPQTCDVFRAAPTGACQQILATFRTTAPQVGISCP